MKRIVKVAILAAAVILVAAAALIISSFRTKKLVLKDRSTGKVYGSFELEAGTFAVEFIHSVNKSPVKDCYEVRSDGIYVVKTIYYGFGAGVQTELNPGESLDYGPDGEMIISNIDKKIEPLGYVVGTVSDHILYIGEREISLRDLCGRNAHVLFSYE